MACFCGNWEEFYGEVLLLDERKITLTAERGIKKSSKAAAVLQQVFSHLKVVEVEFFGLRFCDDKQQTHWLDPSKSLSQHRDLVGLPYIFYFGVKFYAEDPSKLKDETTRVTVVMYLIFILCYPLAAVTPQISPLWYQFYLQLRQDVRRGRLLCPLHLKARFSALMLQAEQGDLSEAEQSDSEENQEVQHIYKTLRGVSRHQAQSLFLSLCSSLQTFGVSLFTAYGENQTEYFLGPTPVGLVIYKNKVLVGKYFWQRITKLHFKDDTFELQVVGKRGSETSFFFKTSDRLDCKRLWRCCVEHHVFFRMLQSSPSTEKLKHNNLSRSNSRTLPQINIGVLRNKTINNKTPKKRPKHHTNQTASVSSEPMSMQTAPPAVQRSDGAEQDQVKPSAPWENSGPLSGLFNPKFPPNTKEEEGDGGRPQRRSRSLDGDRPIRREGRRRSPDSLTWRHIQKQLVEPAGVIDRQTEEIPYKGVRFSGEPIRTRRSHLRGRQRRRWASASDLQSTTDLVPPLPVTKATDTSCQLPTSP